MIPLSPALDLDGDRSRTLRLDPSDHPCFDARLGLSAGSVAMLPHRRARARQQRRSAPLPRSYLFRPQPGIGKASLERVLQPAAVHQDCTAAGAAPKV